MQIPIKKIKVFLLLTFGYACIVLVIYLWTSSANRLTFRLQTQDVPFSDNNNNSQEWNMYLYQPPSIQHSISETKRETKHRTFLKTRTRCTQKFLLLILVPSSPLNFKNRRVIRQTWGTDHAMNKTWRTIFLLGQPKHPMEMKYLSAEAKIYGDIVQGSQTDSYYNLTLKTEMGLEWAVKYCDFDFLLKADDDVFINPYKLLNYLSDPETPKSRLYLGNVATRSKPERKGKWGLSYEEYQRKILPKFCVGPAYVLSVDVVRQFVSIFEPKKPLKLEDVYIGLLAERVGVKPQGHRGFITNKYRQCSQNSELIAMHEASLYCIIKLFNKALEERYRQAMKQL
ncbi:beta-1,3-galactosyltransferase 5-like [Oculina patagonica]